MKLSCFVLLPLILLPSWALTSSRFIKAKTSTHSRSSTKHKKKMLRSSSSIWPKQHLRIAIAFVLVIVRIRSFYRRLTRDQRALAGKSYIEWKQLNEILQDLIYPKASHASVSSKTLSLSDGFASSVSRVHLLDGTFLLWSRYGYMRMVWAFVLLKVFWE